MIDFCDNNTYILLCRCMPPALFVLGVTEEGKRLQNDIRKKRNERTSSANETRRHSGNFILVAQPAASGFPEFGV